MRVLEMLDNKWLSQMVADLRKVMKLNRHNSLFKSGRIEESLQEHRALMQALAQAGGLTARGTTRGSKVHRKDAAGAVQVHDIKMNDPVERDDVIYVTESLF